MGKVSTKKRRCVRFIVNPENKTMAELMKNLARLRNDNKLCDLTLIVGENNEEIYAHKVILCAYSSYFDTMLNGSFVESGKTTLRMTDVDPDTLKVIINYMYSGKLIVEPTIIHPLVVLAKFLQMPSLANACESHMGDDLCLENCMENIRFSGKYSLFNLCERSLKMAARHFHIFFQTEGFMQIDIDELGKLFAMHCIQRYPTDIMFTTILNWLNYDKERRMQHVFALLDTLDPCLVSTALLNSTKLTPYRSSLLNEWLENTVNNDKANSQKDVFISRRVGLFKTHTYSLNSNRKERRFRTKPPLNDGSYVGCGYNVFYTGGWKTKTVFNSTYCMDLYRHEWAPFTPLLHERAYHRSCFHDADIYSIGGSNGLIALNSVEKIDLFTGKSYSIANLPHPTELMGVGIYENAIFCMGGSDRGRELKVANRYDPRTGNWETLQTFPCTGITSCAVLGNNIYCTDSKSLQRFNPKTNSWTRIYTIYNRYPDEIFVTDNVLYGLFKDHIASYASDHGKWSIVKQFKYHSDHLTAVSNIAGCPDYDMVDLDVKFDDDE